VTIAAQQIVGRERSQLVSYDNLSVTWLTAAASTQTLYGFSPLGGNANVTLSRMRFALVWHIVMS
jgi:hypothetical protein